ncbi:MarR family winged helix-turn-helix transcriptional regulator [Winogradskyella sp. A3E31]|uniref:MarR family winged helix-turn-helix transcriptional regulator n=1 Tax=Winogradskyella sp. A3E31 TaxID=3349637 RepID=UPI00398B1A20
MKQLEEVLKTSKSIPLSKATVIRVFYSNNGIKDELLSALKPFDLSIEQFNVLRILRGQKGQPINLQDIQDRMVSKMSNTTRLVDKLIKKDFVQRQTCETNRRKVDISITDEGLAILKTLDPLIDQAEQNVTQNLSKKELEQLNILLSKLNF